VVCELHDQRTIVRQPVGAAPVGVGEVLPLSADPARVHLFDPRTTERLP
jgi:hypothetical protein